MKRTLAPGALELLEEAMHLLRTAHFSVLARHLIGTLPFTLAFLYFWSDMSRGADARAHLTEGSFLTALLFLWMSLWQSAFALGLRATLSATPEAPWTPRRIGRLIVSQTAIQSTSLLAIPVSALMMIPLGWVYAFYQNATAYADDEQVFRKSKDQAMLWPGQNHLLLSYASFLYLIVFLDIVLALFLIPYLVRLLTGIDTFATRSPIQYVFNTTFFAAATVLTYVCLDPLMKAVYVLRCFYGESIHSGEDLRVSIRRLAAALVLVIALLLPVPGRADATPPPAVNTQQLDRSLDTVLHRPEFSWRRPREAAPEPAAES